MRRLLAAAVALVALVGTGSAHAAPPTGSLVLTARGTASGLLVLGKGESLGDGTDWMRPADVSFRGRWAALVVRDRLGDVVYGTVYRAGDDFGWTFGRLWSPVGAGRYRVTIAGDGPVTLRFGLSGSHQRRTVALASPARAHLETADLVTGPTQPTRTVDRPLDVPAGAFAMVAAEEGTGSAAVQSDSICLRYPQGDCDSFSSLPDLHTSGSRSGGAVFYYRLPAGRYVGHVEQTSIGVDGDLRAFAAWIG